MKKRTLTFSSLEELVRFAKVLPGGYLLNTITLTIKTTISEELLDSLLRHHNIRCLTVDGEVPAAA